MANDVNKSIKFVADVQGIYEALNKLVKDIQSMQASLVVNLVTADGKPLSQAFNHALGGNFSSSAGGILMPSGLVSGSPGEKSGPPPGMPGSGKPSYDNEFQRFRQENTSYHYLEAQRALTARQNSIDLMTGGKGGSSFLSDKLADLQRQNDPKLQGTIGAIGSLKDKFDELSKTIASLNEKEKLSLGNAEELANIAKERETASRTQQQIIQTAGGSEGGGPDPIQRIIRTMLAAATVKVVGDAVQDFLGAGSRAQQERGAISSLATRAVGAATRVSAADLFSTLNPDVLNQAMLIGDSQYWSPFAGGATNVGSAAAAGGQQGGGRGAAVAGSLAALSEGGSAAFSLYNGGAPLLSHEAMAINSSISAALQERGVQVMAGQMGSERLANRQGVGESYGVGYGLRGMRTASVGEGGFLSNTIDSGFSENDQLSALMSGQGMGGGTSGFMRILNRLQGVGRQARGTGISSDEIMGQISRMNSMDTAGTDLNFQKQEDMMARAFARGYDNAELAKRNTDAVIALASRSGGAGGPVDTGIFEKMMSGAGQGTNVGTSLGVAAGNKIFDENTQRSGLGGLMNMLAAQRVVNQFFPDVDAGTRSRLTLLLARHDPSEFGSETVQREIMGEVERGGGSGNGGRLPSGMMEALSSGKEAIKGRFAGIYGSSSSFINRAIGEDGPLLETLGIQDRRNQIINGTGAIGDAGAGSHLIGGRHRAAMNAPNVRQQVEAEKAAALLSDRGIGALDAAITKLVDTGGSLSIMTKMLEGAGEHLEKIGDNMKAVDVLRGVADQLSRIKNTESGMSQTEANDRQKRYFDSLKGKQNPGAPTKTGSTAEFLGVK
jgi:hypothetical protein